MRRIVPAAALVLALAAIGSASAQELVEWQGLWVTPSRAAALAASLEPAAPAAPTFGTSDVSRYTIGACDATVRNFSAPWQNVNCELLSPIVSASATATSAGFPVHLPAGALITSVTVNYFDTTTNSNPGMSLQEIDSEASQHTVAAMQIGIFSGGLTSKTVAVNPPHQVDASKPLVFNVLLKSADITHIEGFINAHVDYMLQVSPAPLTATFGDVPTTHPFFQFIEALAAAGITGGCGGANYCPDNPVTRGQMAVFLAKALGLHFTIQDPD